MKIQTGSTFKFSLTPNTSVQQVLSPLFQTALPFSKNTSTPQPPGQDQQNGKHRVNFHPTPLTLISGIHPFVF